MKHAFLIIAHNNFGILQRLISMLDSDNNYFFVHIDKKQKVLPDIYTQRSKVYMCNNRIDVRWGNVSQIQCELNLLDFAFQHDSSFNYYHIVSGTTLPLVSIDDFDNYFIHKPSAVFQHMDTSEYEKDIKIRRWNLCTKTFKHQYYYIEFLSQLVWRIANILQRLSRIGRFKSENFIKASNWCSLSNNAVSILLSKKEDILNKYKWTFCGDEFFAPTELSKSLISQNISFREDYIYQKFVNANPKYLSEEEYEAGKKAGFIWGRKFNDSLL